VKTKDSPSGAAKRAHLRKCGPATTTLIADPSRMSCQLMAAAFEQSPYPIEVVALAVDSLEVQRAAKQFQPDVAVISAGLKDGPKMGLKTARELWVSDSKTKAIILIDASARGAVTEVFRAGAHGIICRDDPSRSQARTAFASISLVCDARGTHKVHARLYLNETAFKARAINISNRR